jgi:hypothetical protein
MPEGYARVVVAGYLLLYDVIKPGGHLLAIREGKPKSPLCTVHLLDVSNIIVTATLRANFTVHTQTVEFPRRGQLRWACNDLVINRFITLHNS